jgi:energy-coupling factor transporter transmembrane protein EcfT
MNHFNLITSLILFGLTILCFWFPYKHGNKQIGIITGVILSLIIAWTILAELEFLVIFIWPFLLVFQITFLTYWTFRICNRPKTGKYISSILTLGFILLCMSPWISDWTFSKNDALKILAEHNIELKDDFKILKNESGGFMDYAHTLKIQISDSDKSRIAKEIRESKGFLEVVDFKKDYPSADYETFEKLNFETKNYLNREYYVKEPMEDGTKHFHFQLSKTKNELQYIGRDE